MLPKGKGKIINIASLLSFFGGFTVPAYAASKGGVMQLTKGALQRMGEQGHQRQCIGSGLYGHGHEYRSFGR